MKCFPRRSRYARNLHWNPASTACYNQPVNENTTTKHFNFHIKKERKRL
jgi:hypothetical protein